MTLRIINLVGYGCMLIGLFFAGSNVAAQHSMPAVTSVPLSETEVLPGALVVFDEMNETYQYPEGREIEEVYGVVSTRPPFYLETATATVPVVIDGVSQVRVQDTNGNVTRGDLLRISDTSGTAERATEEDDSVFAVALEAVEPDGENLILADISVTRATALRDARVEAGDPDLVDEPELTAGAIAATTARIIVALGIAVSSLAFILYTYRSIWVTGVTAVGRNPRARSAVLLMNVASSIVILLLAMFVVVVALGVLVVSI